MLPQNTRPIRLSRRAEAFDSDEFIYELKIDGFRALAYIENGQCDLVSRNRNTFRNFKHAAEWIGENLRVESAVLDGEICCLDEEGRPNFRDLRSGNGRRSSSSLICSTSMVRIFDRCHWLSQRRS
jgi:bifunctional non-homologous end joining protein LigD